MMLASLMIRHRRLVEISGFVNVMGGKRGSTCMCLVHELCCEVFIDEFCVHHCAVHRCSLICSIFDCASCCEEGKWERWLAYWLFNVTRHRPM